MQWEYKAVNWWFRGPELDDWPGREKHRSESPAVDHAMHATGLAGPAPIRDFAHDEYDSWRRNVEDRYLNQLGFEGYELIALFRDVDRQGRWPVVTISAYFKRSPGHMPRITKDQPVLRDE